jgi:Ca2+-binding RTX toxin-like protein
MATITGTLGNDTIKGTTGADEMIGLTGNDLYTVNHCDDEVVEAPGGGTDTVVASHLFKLSDNVENLTLTGKAAIDGYGNDENNLIIGNSGPNLLVTGAGIDTVNGGAGTDVYGWLDTIAGKDTITDFDSGVDILDVSDLLSGFDPLASNAGDFVRFLQSGGNTTVQLDVDGKVGGSDFVTLVTLKGVTATVDGFVFNGSLDLT